MALKAVLSKTEYEALAEPVRAEYKESAENSGVFNIDVAGMVPEVEITKLKGTVKEFRDNNLTLISERDGLKTQLKAFDGIDVEEHKILKESQAKLKKVGINKTDDLATLIAEQVAKATEPLQKTLNTITEEREILARKNAAMTVDDHIRTIALKAGARETALEDVLHRGRQVFRYADGRVVAMDGDKPRFSEVDPAKPLTADEWVSGLAKTADFLFKPSGGGGAEGGAGGNGAATKVLINPTAAEFGKHAADIASGKVEVRSA